MTDDAERAALERQREFLDRMWLAALDEVAEAKADWLRAQDELVQVYIEELGMDPKEARYRARTRSYL